MVKLKVNHSKVVNRKLNEFKKVRAERVDQLKIIHSHSNAALSHAVTIDPVIIQINGFITQVLASAVPESIELINDRDLKVGPDQVLKVVEVKNVNDLIIKKGVKK